MTTDTENTEKPNEATAQPSQCCELLCAEPTVEVEQNVCVVRLTTSVWNNDRGVHLKKSLNFLKRQCAGFNILAEDCLMIGAEEVVPKIINIDSVPDGVYRVVLCNASRDWVTGHVDDYDYKLVSA
jgi:hypothetical protein